MTRLGFLLDSGACIGCHACTVACKSEHDVPLGVNRTWVNYVETGEFPQTQRHFTVMRCNHCDDAPCISICPTGALFRASNGVVDFDDSRCIGCKGCMNACPYDALYISPATGTAHKCNFCQHRLEVGLEPSCVAVCPTRAITVVDHDDPDDAVAERIQAEQLPVRAPERRTLPKVHYAGTVPEALDPLTRPVADDGLIWADWTGSAVWPPASQAAQNVSQAEPAARTAYTVPHDEPWGAKVAGYMVTKGVAAGVMLWAAAAALLGWQDRAAVATGPALIALVALAVTGILLIADLKRPERFWYLFAKGRLRSWITAGAWVIMIDAALVMLWGIAGLWGGSTWFVVLIGPTAVFSLLTAVYTALLLRQCRGRVMWADRPALALIGRLAGEAALGGGAVWGAFVALRADAAVFAWTPVIAAGVLVWLYRHDRAYLRAAQAMPLS
ncbi:4Fe-4S dicluster domain-containing protein [Candidatus Poriferisodalis sp.]|uniref:4Fe-4S dicluster domain-containing protein n=1 Tax=Candidatus Poriferisodalis sp. TaxID=3101277 RepID=UPI003B01757B